VLYIGEYASGERSRIGQAFEYSLDYQHVVRSSGNRDVHHFRPILPHPLPSTHRGPTSERILRLTILLVSRDCQSQNPVSQVFEAFLYSSVRNKWAPCCSSCVHKAYVAARKSTHGISKLKHTRDRSLLELLFCPRDVR